MLSWQYNTRSKHHPLHSSDNEQQQTRQQVVLSCRVCCVELAIQHPIKTSSSAFFRQRTTTDKTTSNTKPDQNIGPQSSLPRSASSVDLSRRALNSEQGAHVENRLRFGILTLGNSFAQIRQNHKYVTLVSSLDDASFQKGSNTFSFVQLSGR